MPAAYERWLVPTVFRPFAIDLAERVAKCRPRRILELAAGTGVVTQELVAAVPDAEVTATDLNEAMVELGRAREPNASWQTADAMALPFDDASFDVIVCQFGVMFFPGKPAAFAEARRVLTADGRLLFNAWGALSAHAYQSALVGALEVVFPDDPPAFMAAVVHGYSDPEVIAADLVAGGLRGSVESITLQGNATSVADVAAGYCTGTPLRAALEARGDLATMTAVVAREMAERLGPDPVAGPMSAHVVEATR